MNFYQHLLNLKKNENTVNVGNKWTDFEANKLLEAIQSGKSIDTIAIDHKRTSGGIRARLFEIGYKLFKDGKSIEEISNIIKISKTDIEIEIEKKQNKTPSIKPKSDSDILKNNENVGNKWTNFEENKLLEAIQSGKDIDTIAIDHKRTPGGIRSRLFEIGYKLFKDGKSIEEISNIIKISKTDIEIEIEKKQNETLSIKPKSDSDILKNIEIEIEKKQNKTPSIKPKSDSDILKNIEKILLRIEAEIFKK
jgi:exoribonuclease II